MLLHLFHFPFHSTPTCPHLPSHIPPHHSSCPWAVHISSLASTFPILFLPSPCLFFTYHLCYLFSVPFPPLSPSHKHPPPLSSCPWVRHISSVASPFPILFLPSPCLFSTYHLCLLFPVPFPPFFLLPLPLITLHVISISVILCLF